MEFSHSAEKKSRRAGADEVRCLLIPLVGCALLVPNSSVAEVVRSAEIVPLQRKSSWILGLFSWRGTSLPVISFERLSGAEGKAKFSHIAVLNSLSPNPALPFFAVATQGIPRSVNVVASAISSSEEEPRRGILQEVLLEGDEVLIPDFDSIEKWLLERKGIELPQPQTIKS